MLFVLHFFDIIFVRLNLGLKSPYKKYLRGRECRTGAMYSSVPTKEFDALIGSAMKIGACWFLCDLFLSFEAGIISCEKQENI